MQKISFKAAGQGNAGNTEIPLQHKNLCVPGMRWPHGKTSVSATTPVLKCPTAYFSKASEPEVLSACLSFGIDDFGVPFWGTGSYN